MRTLKHRRAILVAPIVLLFLLAMLGCGWRRTMQFPSPSGTRTVEVLQTRLDNSWGARVELVTPTERFTLYRLHKEAFVSFVHVYWSPGEAKVAVLATGFAMFNLAVDTRTGEPAAFDDLRQGLAQSIKQAYAVPPGEDPISWAASSQAQLAFRRLHPEIKLSYHD
jgi:hypothetical protein